MGRISPNHIIAATKNKDVELSAVCDLNKSNIAEALTKAKFTCEIPQYTDYKKMIAEIEPNMVAIATSSGSHAEIGKYCLTHNCNTLIEKPIAMNLKDAQDLIDLAKENALILGVCHQNRFNKSVQYIHQAISDGRFGKLSHVAAHVRWNRNMEYYKQAPWRGTWASDGGCLMNQCIHNADLLYWIIGEIEEVFAYTNRNQHPYIEAEDVGLAIVKGKDGTLGLLEGTVNVFPKNLEETLYIFGECGTVKAAGTSVNLIDEWQFADNKDNPEEIKKVCSEMPPNIYGFGHARLYCDFVNAIKQGTQPLVTGEEGKKALELILAIYKSKKTGYPVKLPINDFSTIDMIGTFTNQ